MLHSVLTGEEKSRDEANALFDFTFENFQIKSGEHKGMLRWSEAGWYDCYQDDVARAVIPALLCQFFEALAHTGGQNNCLHISFSCPFFTRYCVFSVA